ncbi:hypothetical protein JAAARDRAFT_51555 [Jaapia argillacea MUCL 33604]|uniref:Restriction of telomere capping protein 4 n=1 Tax=Jaapia argillacea MUCL 33604 TaxID=933084 RepID=A0A067P7T4_9AGAM|nr:hypothetical protein JAAARDRAFT_51555 [Jaapia argillacea MUCL 33604]
MAIYGSNVANRQAAKLLDCCVNILARRCLQRPLIIWKNAILSQLNPPSVNKGTGNSLNRNRIHRTCTNRWCRYVLFLTDVLHNDIAPQIVKALISGRLSMDDLANLPNTNHVVSHQPRNPPHAQLLSEPSTTPSLSTSTRSAAAVHCATVTCVTKGGTRTKGSTQCSGKQCISCCQSLVKSQIAAGIPQRACAYNKHRLSTAVVQELLAKRVATGVHPTDIAALSTRLSKQHGHTMPTERHVISPSSSGLSAASTRTASPLGSGIQQQPLVPQTTSSSSQPLTAPSTHHAAPLASMWQNVSPEWLQQHQLASSKQDSVINKKQRASELATKIQVKIMYWSKPNEPAVTFPVDVEHFPKFSLSHYPAISDSFGLLNDQIYLEAYDAGWERHTRATSRTVAKGDILLYRALPSGLQGPHLSDSECPGLDTYIRKHGPIPGKGKGRAGRSPLSSSSTRQKREWPCDSISVPNDETQISEPLPKRRRKDNIIDLTLDSESDDELPSTISQFLPKVEERDAPPSFVEGSSRTTILQSRKRRSRKGDLVSIWPTSYSAAYILAGFEKMDLLLAQRSKGKLRIPNAFCAAFDGARFVQSTFSVHWGVYGRAKTLGKDLISKFKRLEASEDGKWPEFVAAFKDIESGQQAPVLAPSLDPPATVTDEEMPHAVTKPMSRVIVDDDYDSSDSSDDGFMALDSRLLCPFCDEIYPLRPSQCLRDQCDELKARSTPAPDLAITRNKDHLRIIPATAAAQHCERHRFESSVAAQASREHWPTDINLSQIPSRIKSLLPTLSHIVHDPDTNSYFQKLEESVKEDGTMQTFYLNGEYGVMKSIGVGYYGPKGYQTIYLSLLEAFPDLKTNGIRYIGRNNRSEPQPIHVPGNIFVNRVLVPEVAILLIQADLNLLRDQAIKTKKASDTYGFIMFPDDEDDHIVEPTKAAVKLEESPVRLTEDSDIIIIDD